MRAQNIKLVFVIIFFLIGLIGLSQTGREPKEPETTEKESSECPCHAKPSRPSVPAPLAEIQNPRNNYFEPEDPSHKAQLPVTYEVVGIDPKPAKCQHTCGKPKPPNTN